MNSVSQSGGEVLNGSRAHSLQLLGRNILDSFVPFVSWVGIHNSAQVGCQTDNGKKVQNANLNYSRMNLRFVVAVLAHSNGEFVGLGNSEEETAVQNRWFERSRSLFENLRTSEFVLHAKREPVEYHNGIHLHIVSTITCGFIWVGYLQRVQLQVSSGFRCCNQQVVLPLSWEGTVVGVDDGALAVCMTCGHASDG